MSIRILAFVLLAGASVAHAAPPNSAQPKTQPTSEQPADAIDVDALARAKDAQGAQPAAADAPPDVVTPAAAPAVSPADTATTATPAAAPADAPATPAISTAAEAVPAETATPSTEARPAEAPSPTAVESAEQSIAASCASRASSLLDDAAKADYGSATRDFTAKMRTDLPTPKFKQQWESLAQFGKLVARGQSHLGQGQGYTLVMIPLIFEKTNLVAQIACGTDGRIAGFHVTQAPKPQF